MENFGIATPIDQRESLFVRLRNQAYLIFGIVGMFFVIEAIDLLSGQSLEVIGGIKPRQASGLIGIPFAPFLHGDWQHLFANMFPFIILGGLVILSTDRQRFIGVSGIVALTGGLGTWTFGAGGYHIGASSLVFGYLGFLLWRAWFGRNLLWTIIALLAGFLYGGIIVTLVKNQHGISWSGHFFGLLGGILAAFIYTPNPAAARLPAGIGEKQA